MNVRLTPFTYIRFFEEECLLFNPRTEAGCVVNHANAVLLQLSSRCRDVDCMYEIAAQSLGVHVTEIRNDYESVLVDLISAGLVECACDDESIAPVKVSQKEFESIDDGNSIDYVNDFYKRHNLPSELHMDVTSYCNERCVHCYWPEHKHINMPIELVHNILREFRAMQGMTVYISGGECMTHPQFEEICSSCKKKDLNIIILSNLTCCTDKRIDFLRNVNPQFINVSLYSMDEGVHDAITQIKGSWRKTMDAFLKCEKAGIALRIASPLLSANKNSFNELKKFADKHNVHLVPDINIFPKTNFDASNVKYTCSLEDITTTLMSNREVFRNVLLFGGGLSESDRVCRIGSLRLYVNANGDYYPCDAMHGYVLGNARKDSMVDVWNSKKMCELRNLRLSDMKKCQACSDRPYCLVCPAHNFDSTGDITQPGTNKCSVAAITHHVYGGKGTC